MGFWLHPKDLGTISLDSSLGCSFSVGKFTDYAVIYCCTVVQQFFSFFPWKYSLCLHKQVIWCNKSRPADQRCYWGPSYLHLQFGKFGLDFIWSPVLNIVTILTVWSFLKKSCPKDGGSLTSLGSTMLSFQCCSRGWQHLNSYIGAPTTSVTRGRASFLFLHVLFRVTWCLVLHRILIMSLAISTARYSRGL